MKQSSATLHLASATGVNDSKMLWPALTLECRTISVWFSTNATFSIEYVQDLVSKLSGNVVLVIDEAHNFGAENLSRCLLPHIPYRLALSATIDRHGDPEGTAKLYDYFGDKCIEYTLKDAIDNDMLTPSLLPPRCSIAKRQRAF